MLAVLLWREAARLPTTFEERLDVLNAQEQRSRTFLTQMLQSPTAYFFERLIFKYKPKKMADVGGERIDEKCRPDQTGPTESSLHSSRVNKTPFFGVPSHDQLSFLYSTKNT